MKIGLLSDTHGFIDKKILDYLMNCDEIWHVGDIGPGILALMPTDKILRAVHGNIDDRELQTTLPEMIEIELAGLKVLMVHIAGKPPNYTYQVSKKLKEFKPAFLICGHSHLAKVMRDHKNNLIYINPGAAGQHGFHRMRTMMTFRIESGKITDLMLIELGKRGQIKNPEGGEHTVIQPPQ